MAQLAVSFVDKESNVVNPAGFQYSKFDHRMTSMVMPLVRAIEKRGEKPYLTVCYVDFKWKAQTLQGTLNHAKNPEEFAEFVLVFFERLKEKFGLVPEAFELVLEPLSAHRKELLGLLGDLIALRDAGRFPLRADDDLDHGQCGRCDYRLACRHFHGATLERVQSAPEFARYFEIANGPDEDEAAE